MGARNPDLENGCPDDEGGTDTHARDNSVVVQGRHLVLLEPILARPPAES